MNTFLTQWNRYFVFAAFLSIFLNLIQFAYPLYMFTVLREVLTSYSRVTLDSITAVALFAVGCYILFFWLRGCILTFAGEALNQAVRGDACQMQIRATAFGLSKERYAQGLSDLEILVRFFSGTAMTTLFEFPWAPLYLIMIYLMMPALGVVVTVGGLIMVGLSLLKSRVVGDISPSLSEEKKRQKQWTSTVLRNAEAINAMGMFQRVNDITESRLATLSRHETIAAKASTTLNALVGGMQLFIQLSIYFVGALLALKYGADFSMVIVISIIMRMALGPLTQMIAQWDAFTATWSAYRRLHYFVEISREISRQPALPIPKISGHLMVQGAACTVQHRFILKGVSFQVSHGTFLGLIGASGAGKTTLCKLILGMIPPRMGRVTIDGTPPQQLSDLDRQRVIGYLPQEVYLFPGTMAENIARMGPVDLNLVKTVAMLCGIHEWIESLPEGYETPLEGEKGITLSGGQKQRVAMARAVYGFPPLIVLDEPTSSLDRAGMEAFLTLLSRLKAQAPCTCIVVTHTPMLLDAMDRVLMVDKGSVLMRKRTDPAVTDFFNIVPEPHSPDVKPPTGEHSP